jgi:nucleoside-diphosphate-sugar epimerase
MDFFSGKTVLVTGGAGFLGSYIVERLTERGAEVFVPRRAQYDLADRLQVEHCFVDAKPQIVIHCAAFYGGMRMHELYPAKIYYENLVMGAHLMEVARLSGVEKFVSAGTDCSYPGYLNKDVLSEDDLWNGAPHETALDYGLAKKALAIQGWAYRKQYDFHAIHVILTNMYGPRDAFHPDKSHVVAALIRKFIEAKRADKNSVEVWGSGKPTRNFLYVEDAADGLLLATEKYDDTAPMNVTTDGGSTVRELAETIAKLTGFSGRLEYNTTRPDGQMKKILDVSRMKQVLGWAPQTSLEDGLRKTIRWYEEHKAEADAATPA